MRRAYEAARKSGGGTVLVPAGRWITGPFDLASHTTLVLEAGAYLQAVKNGPNTMPDDWPQVPWKEHPLEPAYGPGPRHRALIRGVELVNVTILGPGGDGGATIDGQGERWWSDNDSIRGSVDKHKTSPDLIHVLETRGLRVEGVTLKNSASYTLHPQFCTGVRISGVTVRNPLESHSTNGIVLDSCRDCYVGDSTVDTGKKEDTIVVKSGKDFFGRRKNRPSINILIERCRITNGHAVSVGSEMSGSVFNVTFRDIEFDGSHSHGFGAGSVRLKAQRGRGGVIDGVLFENIHGREAIYGVEFYMFYTKKSTPPTNDTATPKIRNITVRNMKIKGVTRHAGVLAGLPEAPIENLVLEDIHISHAKKGGWECHKFKECDWKEGGCTTGTATNVEPHVPCLRPPG